MYNFNRGEKNVQKIPPRWNIGKQLYDAYAVDHVETVPVHWRSHFLLNIITEGNGIQIINGKQYPLSEGSIVILSPLDFHQNIVKNNKMSLLTVKFSDKVFYDAISKVCSFDDFPIVTILKDANYETAKYLFSLLKKESENLTATDTFATSLIQQLTILALRSFDRRTKTPETTPVRKALAFIQYNFKQNIKVSDVANHIGYSENYFSQKFKAETGMEFQKYLLDLRLEFAMKLLRFSSLSVTEVCFESGFNTVQHFSSAFKKKFGKSAKNFKAKAELE